MAAISKYSNYAQFKNVDSKVNAMINFNQSGVTGQIIGSDGTNGLIWVDSDPSSASYWSEYPATQNVDIANNDIDNVANLIANKIKIGELSYQSAFPIGIEVAFDENTFTTGIIAQNKDSANTSSVSILLTNDLGTDSAYYGGLTMFSSNTVPTYGFPSIKNAISLNSQSSSVVISPWNGQQDGTADENGNIMLTYSGGSKAHIINNNGQLIVGANNPSYSGSTYGGDNGGTDNVLTSNGTNGLKWITPEYAPLWSQYPATQTIDASGNDINDVGTLNVNTLIKNDINRTSLDMVNNRLIFQSPSATEQTIYNYNTIFMQNFANDDVLSIQTNNININDQAGGINNYNAAGISRMISPTYWNTQYADSITIEKLTTTQKSILNDSSLSLTDIASDNSLLTPTNLTFNGIPYNRNMVNSSLIYSSLAIYADSTYPPATNLLIRNTYGYSGWAFINTAIGSKFNYYFAPQSPTTQVQDIKGISFNYFNVTQTSNDYQIFCTIYTKPQPGDVTFYHSKRNYIFDQSITPTINTAYQACVLVDKSLISYYYETQINYQLDPLNQVGPFLPTEEVLAVVLSSDSACPAGTMSVVLSKLNIIMDGFTKEFLLVSP